MNIQHSSKSADWRTPTEVLDAVKELFGGSISLDAASDENAQKRVGALRWLGSEFDALSSPWPEAESIFLNPPGGKVGKESQTKLFWNKLVDEVNLRMGHNGRNKHGHAVFLAFSMEALQTCQDQGSAMLSFPLCVPNKRLRFVPSDETVVAKSPSHANVIVYVPGYKDETKRFVEIFSRFGACRA
jgi:hypothetical protein